MDLLCDPKGHDMQAVINGRKWWRLVTVSWQLRVHVLMEKRLLEVGQCGQVPGPSCCRATAPQILALMTTHCCLWLLIGT